MKSGFFLLPELLFHVVDAYPALDDANDPVPDGRETQCHRPQGFPEGIEGRRPSRRDAVPDGAEHAGHGLPGRHEGRRV